jgi:hypothetical protein
VNLNQHYDSMFLVDDHFDHLSCNNVHLLFVVYGDGALV